MRYRKCPRPCRFRLSRFFACVWAAGLLLSGAPAFAGTSPTAGTPPTEAAEVTASERAIAPFPPSASMAPVPSAASPQETEASAEKDGKEAAPRPAWAFPPEALPPWRPLADGLALGLFPARDGFGNNLELVILRIDPAAFVFTVHTATGEGEALSLGEWSDRHGLTAAINASMYLPDGRTSTGYLRADGHVNNGRIAGRFGAFFVSGPLPPQTAASSTAGTDTAAAPEPATPGEADGLPEAALLDRSADAWETVLPRYRYVVQNYRLISADRRLLWNPGGPRHAIAAVGRDGTGHILFIHCREPLTGVDFGTLLLSLPIDVRVVMYTEGGSQAGLLVRAGTLDKTWMGRHPADIWTAGNPGAPLPNIIGIRPKEGGK